jgi:triosephosphate isomerase (TIM)
VTRRRIIAGNWKMNLGRESSVNLASAIADTDLDDSTDVLVFPATAWIVPVADMLQGTDVHVGGQNCHFETNGAFTGEVSAPMLAEVCSYVLSGHSERRHLFGESDETVGKKVRAILDAGLSPVLCVGETLDERSSDNAEVVVKRHLSTGLEHVAPSEIGRVVVAYEPVWAIGTGVSATPEDAQSMCRYVRQTMVSMFGPEAGNNPVLYGGSVTAENAPDLLMQADIDGGLVGGASLDVQSFRAIIEASQRL